VSDPGISPAQVSVVLDAMIHDFQAMFPGIGRDTATLCLITMSEVMRDCGAANEAETLFLNRIEEAEGRREAWALDVRRAVKSKERGGS
jgi:hypothetical protein